MQATALVYTIQQAVCKRVLNALSNYEHVACVCMLTDQKLASYPTVYIHSM